MGALSPIGAQFPRENRKFIFIYVHFIVVSSGARWVNFFSTDMIVVHVLMTPTRTKVQHIRRWEHSSFERFHRMTGNRFLFNEKNWTEKHSMKNRIRRCAMCIRKQPISKILSTGPIFFRILFVAPLKFRNAVDLFGCSFFSIRDTILVAPLIRLHFNCYLFSHSAVVFLFVDSNGNSSARKLFLFMFFLGFATKIAFAASTALNEHILLRAATVPFCT